MCASSDASWVRIALWLAVTTTACGDAPGPERPAPQSTQTERPDPGWSLSGEDLLPAGRLTAGDSHACLVDDDGAVWCWGDNESGQLGDGSRARRARAIRVEGLGDTAGVAAGGDTTCAWDRRGTVRCWGGGSGASSRASEREGLRDVVQVALSTLGDQGCARTREGTVRCWPPGATTAHPVPSVTHAVDIAFRGHGACAVQSQGTVVCWRQSTEAPADPEPLTLRVPDAVEVAMIDLNGNGLACVRARDGHLECPGDTDSITDAVAVSGHGHHFCALQSGGAVVCWGNNERGELGVPPGRSIGEWALELTSDMPPDPRPVRVRSLPPARAIAAGSTISCAVVGASVRCWGDRTHVPPARPAPLSWVPGIDDAEEIAASSYETCALGAAGRVTCWGFEDRAPVTRVPSGVTRLVGTDCVVRDDGTHCWEHSAAAQQRQLVARWPPAIEAARLGPLCHRGRGEPWTCNPGLPAELARHTIITAASGSPQGCGAEDARVDCWAGSSRESLELDGTVTSLVYGQSVCAIANGQLRCWQPGHGATLARGRSPDRIYRIAMDGVDNVCGVLESGAVACWRIDRGRGRVRLRGPELLSGAGDMEQIVAGERHFCARSSDGRVGCWGDPAMRGGEPTFVGPTVID